MLLLNLDVRQYLVWRMNQTDSYRLRQGIELRRCNLSLSSHSSEHQALQPMNNRFDIQ